MGSDKCKSKCNSNKLLKGDKGDPGTTIVNLTYSQASALRNANGLINGFYYKITDRADLGITIRALSENKFSLDGEGYFLNPDYGGIGVWHSGLGGVFIGLIVIYSGLQYSNVTGVVGTAPDSDTVNWLLIPKSTSTYILEIDIIRYDFDADTIIYRTDKKGNEVYNNITLFQWGNPNVRKNYDYFGTFNIINNRGALQYNFIRSAFGISINETNQLTIVGTEFGEMSSVDFTNCTGSIGYSNFNSQDSLQITGFLGDGYQRKYIINDVGSTFNAELDISDGNIFNGTVLTIPSSLKHIGIFTLINSAGETIDKIKELPRHNKVRFYVENGNSIIFEVNDIGSFTPNYITGQNPANYTLIGRSFAPDFIELESSEDINSGDFVNTVYKIVIFQP